MNDHHYLYVNKPLMTWVLATGRVAGNNSVLLLGQIVGVPVLQVDLPHVHLLFPSSVV